MVSKTMVKWVGVAAVLASAACTEMNGPLNDCYTGDDSIWVCPTPEAEPADAGVERILR